MTPDDSVVIDIYSEGKTDLGDNRQTRRPNKGVVPILVHKLCDKPDRMKVSCPF